MDRERVDPESLLARAKEQEKEYRWRESAASYANALKTFPKDDPLGTGQIQERRAFSLFRAAMQAEDINEFKKCLDEAEREYGVARKSYSAASTPRASPRVGRCDAMIAYLGFWKTADVPTKKKMVKKAWATAKLAMADFRADEKLEFGETFNQLFLSAVFSLHFSDDKDFRENVLSEATMYAEEAATYFSNAGKREEFAKTLMCKAGFLSATMCVAVLSIGEKNSIWQKAKESFHRAIALSEETTLVQKASAELAYGLEFPSLEEDKHIAETQLVYARRTGDRLSIGATLGILGLTNYFMAGTEEDPEEASATLDRVRRHVEEAKAHFEKIGFISPDYFSNIWLSSPGLPWYHQARAQCEIDPRRKAKLAKDALRDARLEFEEAQKTGYPYVVSSSHFLMGYALTDLAKTEDGKDDREKLLKEAVKHRICCANMEDVLMPSQFWNRAIYYCLIGETELELAEVAGGVEERKKILDLSMSYMRRGLDLFELSFSTPESVSALSPANFLRISNEWRDYGRVLRSSFTLTGDRETIIGSATAFDRSAKLAESSGMPSRVAESLWEAARTYDLCGEHLKSSERFDNASEQYNIAADKLKRLSQLYQEQSIYMKAWSEIEEAKYHHGRQEPSLAKEHYRKAAELHEATTKWAFLSANYLAWAQIENAEDLSQRERCRDSIEAFKESSRLFKDSRNVMQKQLDKIEANDEKQMVARLIGAADTRQELCKARIVLEEARILDMAGSSGSASDKYGLAADMFTKTRQGLAADQDQREIELMATLSKAWRAMARAEAESSPELYEEAARLFDVAKNLSPGDKAVNLAIGHCRFCRALQAGARFSDTGDSAQHEIATDNLESAGKYYLKAGLESHSEYARASRLLFDAYVHMSMASKEGDHEKKAKLYSLAEKVLMASASSYDKANQRGKKEQVLKILAKVRQDKELSVSLAEVLRAPDAVSSTLAFSSPAPTHETAAGLDRFEHAEVQATLIVKPRELLVDQNLNLEIELVNAGRGVAQLTKVDNVIPEGFEVAQEPEKYRIEDSCLNMKGRRLDALRTEDVKLSLRPRSKGQFTVRPRIMYLDESGRYRSFELEPVTVKVKELGISGWLKGSDSRR